MTSNQSSMPPIMKSASSVTASNKTTTTTTAMKMKMPTAPTKTKTAGTATTIGYANGILYVDESSSVNNNNNNNNKNNNNNNNKLTAQRLEMNKVRAVLDIDANRMAAPAATETYCDNDHQQNDGDGGAGLDECDDDDDDDDDEVDVAERGVSGGGGGGLHSSASSMETLSDNVSIWIDGEKHWISGVDASTTCADLILALLNYQDRQQHQHHHQQQEVEPRLERQLHDEQMLHNQRQQSNSTNNNNNNKNNIDENNDDDDDDDNENNLNKCKASELAGAMAAATVAAAATGVLASLSPAERQRCWQQRQSDSNKVANNAINQSTANTKEVSTLVGNVWNERVLLRHHHQNDDDDDDDDDDNDDAEVVASDCANNNAVSVAALAAAPPEAVTGGGVGGVGSIGGGGCGSDGGGIRNVFLSAAQLLCEYVIVRQHRHCEEYLDGSTKVFDVLPTRADLPAPPTLPPPHGPAAPVNGGKKECDLLLRRLAAPSPHVTQMSTLLCTDKDSGMGSPVGSSRSARLRRRRHHRTSASYASWLAQGNTLHPKWAVQHYQRHGSGRRGNGVPAAAQTTTTAASTLEPHTANERLLKIILAQDETIHRQLSLLREKERQISKIEEERHRKRERELGKNYLLETYLNGLDEAEMGLMPQALAQQEAERVRQTMAAAATADNIAVEHCAAGADEPPLIETRAAAKPTSTSRKKAAEREERKRKARKQHQRRDKKDNNNSKRSAEPASCEASAACQPQTEVGAQLEWLEKVHTLNKRLQREEESLLRLHTRIRKHTAKRAYQTRTDVLQKIDQLDAELARKYAALRQLEDNLLHSDGELKQKIGALEHLRAAVQADSDPPVSGPRSTAVAVTRLIVEAQINGPPTPLGADERPAAASSKPPKCCNHQVSEAPDIQLQGVYTTEDLLQLQRLIAKPTAAATLQPALTVNGLSASPALVGAIDGRHNQSLGQSQALHHLQHQQQQHQLQQQQQQQQPLQLQSAQTLGLPLPPPPLPPLLSSSSLLACESKSSLSCGASIELLQQQQQQQQLNDKNMLPLHVNNGKTVKKQMFGPKSLNQPIATTTTTTTIATAIATTATMASATAPTTVQAATLTATTSIETAVVTRPSNACNATGHLNISSNSNNSNNSNNNSNNSNNVVNLNGNSGCADYVVGKLLSPRPTPPSLSLSLTRPLEVTALDITQLGTLV